MSKTVSELERDREMARMNEMDLNMNKLEPGEFIDVVVGCEFKLKIQLL